MTAFFISGARLRSDLEEDPNKFRIDQSEKNLISRARF